MPAWTLVHLGRRLTDSHLRSSKVTECCSVSFQQQNSNQVQVAQVDVLNELVDEYSGFCWRLALLEKYIQQDQRRKNTYVEVGIVRPTPRIICYLPSRVFRGIEPGRSYAPPVTKVSIVLLIV